MASAKHAARQEASSAERSSLEEEGDSSAPEGGWGWFIVVAIAINKMAVWGALPFIGILFQDIVTQTKGAEGSAVTFVLAIFFLCSEATGIAFPALNRRFSLRTTSLAGGFILIFGTVFSVFVNTLPLLATSFGLVQGIGFGLVLSSTMTAFNQYFRRRRTTAMALAQFSTSVMMTGLPHAVQAAMDADGWRGGRLVFVGVAVAVGITQFFVRTPPTPLTPGKCPEGWLEGEKALLDTGETIQTGQVIKEGNKVLKNFANCERVSINSEQQAQTASHAHDREHAESGSRLRRFGRRLWRLLGFDEQLLDDPQVWGAALGMAVVHVGDSNFFALLPMHLRQLGLAKEDITKALAITNVGDASARLALVLVGRWLSSRNRHVVAAGALGTTVSLLGISYLTSWTAVATLSAIVGFSRGMIYIALFLAVAEIVEPALFPSAMGMMFGFFVLLTFVLSPIIGMVRDVTASYPASFCLVSMLMALYPVGWGLYEAAQWSFRRRNNSKKQFPVNESFSETVAVNTKKMKNNEETIR